MCGRRCVWRGRGKELTRCCRLELFLFSGYGAVPTTRNGLHVHQELDHRGRLDSTRLAREGGFRRSGHAPTDLRFPGTQRSVCDYVLTRAYPN
jgi:hypothetical protein